MKLKRFVEHPLFSKMIMSLILLNAILIGLETYPSIHNPYSELFVIMDYILLGIFSLEIILKLIVYKGEFFKDKWNIFDFTIIMVSLLFMSSNFVSVLRIIRVLRVLRTLSAFPSLKRLVNALFLSLPAMGSTLLLMVIVFYVYGIIGTTFFSAVSPEYFGNLQLSLLTLFQVFTLESWASAVFRPIFAEFGLSWLYFSTFIIISAFIVANIFFGELVNNAQKLAQEVEEDDNDMAKELEGVLHELATLREQNAQFHLKLDKMTSILAHSTKEKA